MKRIAFILALIVLLTNGFIAPNAANAQQPGCPPAVEETYYSPTDKAFAGPVIIHPWWNNGRPSFAQTQVKIMVPLGTTVTVFQMMGKSWTYQKNSACASNLSREFQNAPQLGVVSLEQLVREGLGSVAGSPSAPTQPQQPAPQAPAPSSPDEKPGCPPAEEFTYVSPANLVVTGPAIGHLWWNNGKSSFGQTQVKTLVNKDESVALLGVMGKLWRYADTQACQEIMPQEIANAPEKPRVHVSQLVAEGLAFQ